jgi:hypothetical protein
METLVKEFQDERGITIQWNKDWNAEMIEGIISIVCPKYLDESFFSNVSVIIDTLPSEIENLNDLSMMNLGQLDEHGMGEEIEQYVDFSWSNYPAKMVKYHLNQNEQNLVILQCWTLIANQSYTLTYTSTPTQFGVYFDDVIEIIDSTKFQNED